MAPKKQVKSTAKGRVGKVKKQTKAQSKVSLERHDVLISVYSNGKEDNHGLPLSLFFAARAALCSFSFPALLHKQLRPWMQEPGFLQLAHS